jgi:hypothetical protein
LDEGREFFRDYRLHAIGERAVGVVMNFDEQTIGANGDSCA